MLKFIKLVFAEVLGLFIDDGSLAIAIALWVAACTFVLPILISNILVQMSIWVLGLMIVLVENVLRTARQKQM